MNKDIKIENFNLIDYNVLLQVVAEYIKLHQISRKKLEWEKDMFDLTDTVYSLETFKHAVIIDLPSHRKPFYVQVRESGTQYSFKIWYAR